MNRNHPRIIQTIKSDLISNNFEFNDLRSDRRILLYNKEIFLERNMFKRFKEMSKVK